MYQVRSPILFLIFNRPEKTNVVFEEIKNVKPSRLYIAADGPRNDKDKILCEEARQVVNKIDWDCDCKILFRDSNIGCRVAVSSAITWFFENEPEGIVLEDDCVPSKDLFIFFDEMLKYFRNDCRIGHITGSNFQDGIKRGDGSYYFSRLTHVWGWASWRRTWNKYDVDLMLLHAAEEADYLNFLSKKNKLFLSDQIKKVKKGLINTWDYQYFFTNTVNNFLNIIPNNNMIANIGFDLNATHTVDKNNSLAGLEHESLLFPIKHPEIILPYREADEYTLNKEVPSLLAQNINKVKTVIKSKLPKNLFKDKK